MVAAYLLLFLQSSVYFQETETIVLTACFFAVKTHLCLNLFVLVFSVIIPPIHSLHYNDRFLQTAHVTILRRMKDGGFFFYYYSKHDLKIVEFAHCKNNKTLPIKCCGV